MTASAPATTSSPAAESQAAPAAAPTTTAAAPVAQATAAPADKMVTNAAPAAPKAEAPKAEAPKQDAPKADSYAARLEAIRKGEALPADADLDLKAPEGAAEHVVGIVKDVAKLTGLPKDKAQAALEHVHQSLQKQQAEFQAKQSEDWARELFEDPQFGGPKAEKTIRDSEAFIARFVPEAHRSLYAGAIHPSLRIAMAIAHQAISPDKFFVAKNGTAPKAESDSELAKQMFPRSLGRQG